MARVRIFLPTCRRPQLLRRALASLQAQTERDWVCEVHNDAPDDDAPRAQLAALGDSRFVLHQHPRNLGGVASFNLFFRATAEPFYSLHEDDNAWEPAFLETMLATARRFPAATVFWSNMRIWQEEPDGTLRDTGRAIWPDEPADAAPRAMAWGHPRQIFGSLHSNGAMLVRSRPGESFPTPPVPFSVVEVFRERMFPYPLVFVPQILAHFSLTQKSARPTDPADWAFAQTLMVATFLKHARYDDDALRGLWSRARAAVPPQTNVLLLASFAEPTCGFLRRFASGGDWWRFLRSTVRRPGLLVHVLRSRQHHADWWASLDRATAARFAEHRALESALAAPAPPA